MAGEGRLQRRGQRERGRGAQETRVHGGGRDQAGEHHGPGARGTRTLRGSRRAKLRVEPASRPSPVLPPPPSARIHLQARAGFSLRRCLRGGLYSGRRRSSAFPSDSSNNGVLPLSFIHRALGAR